MVEVLVVDGETVDDPMSVGIVEFQAILLLIALRENQDEKRKQSQKRKKKGKKSKVKFDSESDNIEEVENVNDGTASVASLGTASLLRLKGCIQGINVSAMIDTGSEVTIIQQRLFNQLRKKPFIINYAWSRDRNVSEVQYS